VPRGHCDILAQPAPLRKAGSGAPNNYPLLVMQIDRIPDETRALLVGSVAIANRVSQSLPTASPDAWRGSAYRLVLAAILRDWSENDTAELEEEDVTNLSAFVELASSTARQAGMADHDVTFEVVLEALLDDWVENWGESLADEEDEGDEDEESGEPEKE
jgi:hypothetical protein